MVQLQEQNGTRKGRKKIYELELEADTLRNRTIKQIKIKSTIYVK